MTKFQIMSDLHQEHHEGQVIRKDQIIGDVLLLAGDITGKSYGYEFVKNWDVDTLCVLGNHELYRRNWHKGIEDYRLMAKDSKVTLLENDTVIVNGVRIVGATLWTDFHAPVKDKPFFLVSSDENLHIENQALYCRRGMADFDLISSITTTNWVERHTKSRDYIEEVLRNKHDGPTIVMTHHAPSFKSSHPRWENSAIKGGFCSNLEWLIEEYQPDYWLHGHTHEAFDYKIGNTRILCNPRGYGETNKEFNSSLVIEL